MYLNREQGNQTEVTPRKTCWDCVKVDMKVSGLSSDDFRIKTLRE